MEITRENKVAAPKWCKPMHAPIYHDTTCCMKTVYTHTHMTKSVSPFGFLLLILIYFWRAVAQAIIWLIVVFGVWVWHLIIWCFQYFCFPTQDISINDGRMYRKKYSILSVFGSRLNRYTQTHASHRLGVTNGEKQRRGGNPHKEQNNITQAIITFGPCVAANHQQATSQSHWLFIGIII